MANSGLDSIILNNRQEVILCVTISRKCKIKLFIGRFVFLRKTDLKIYYTHALNQFLIKYI